MTEEELVHNIKKTYFITGGGTGGHIYPAMAVANALKARSDTRKIFYVGNPFKPERKIAKSNNFDFLSVYVSSMPRKINLGFVGWIVQLSFAVLQAIFYILMHRPDAVFGTGGYVSAPLLIASVITRTPFMIHDSDAVPGIVSRKIAPYAQCVSIAFEEAKKSLNNQNIHVFGNPIRDSFSTVSRVRALNVLGLEDKFTLLVMGGSQGAKAVNEAVIELYKPLTQRFGMQIIHQTGEKNYDDVVETLRQIYPEYVENPNIIVEPYFSDAAIPMKAADLVISRAGSLSLSEINMCGLPAILVPFPYAAANHQLKNAMSLQNRNAAVCLEENDQLKDNLMSTIENLLNIPELLKSMGRASKNCAKPNATSDIINLLTKITK